MNYVETFYKKYNKLPTSEQLQMAASMGAGSYEDLQTELNSFKTNNYNGNGSSDFKKSLTTGVNAAIGGFGDEIAGSLGLENTKDYIRSSEESLLEENPIAYYGSQIAGSLVPGAAIAKGAKGLGLATKALTAKGKIANAAKLGAAEGALFGAGYADGESASERIDDALSGAAIGGLTGGALSGVGQALGAGINTVRGGSAKGLQEGTKDAFDSVAERIGISSEELLDRLPDEGLMKVLIRQTSDLESEIPGAGQELIQEIVYDIASASPKIRNEMAQNALRKLPKLRKQASEKLSNLSNDLEEAKYSSVDNMDSYQDARRIDIERQKIGENIGNSRRLASINNEQFFDDLIQNDDFALSLVDEIKKVVSKDSKEFYSDLLTDGQGTATGELVFYTTKEAAEKELPSAGIYIKSFDKEPSYELANINADFIDMVSQNFRQKANGLLEEGGNLNTSKAQKYLAAADKMTDTIARHSSDTAEGYYAFRNVDSYKNIRNLTDQILSSNKSGAISNFVDRIDSIRKASSTAYPNSNGNPIRSITDDETVAAVKMAIRDRIKDDSTFDVKIGSSQYKALREIFQKANKENEFDKMYAELIERNSFVEILNQINPTLNKTTDPKKLASALRKAFEHPMTEKAINKLSDSESAAYKDVIEQLLREIELLQYVEKFKTRNFKEPQNIITATLSAIPGTVAVISNINRALAVAALRGVKNAGGWSKAFTQRKYYNGFDETLLKMVKDNPEFLDKVAGETMEDVVSGKIDSSNFVEKVLTSARARAASLIARETSNGEDLQIDENNNNLGFISGSSKEDAFSKSGSETDKIIEKISRTYGYIDDPSSEDILNQ